MTNKNLILSIATLFLAIFLVSSVSAAISFVETSVSTTGSHNSDITVTFSLNNTGTVNYTALNWASSSVSSGNAVWKTLPSSTTLLAGEVKQFSAVLTVNNYASGTVSANIHALSTPAANADLPVTVNITNSPSFTISSTKVLNRTQNGTITITNTGNSLLNLNLTSTGDISTSLSPQTLSLSPGVTSSAISVNSLTDISSLKLGDHTSVILVSDLISNITGSYTYSNSKDFCNNGNVNTSSVGINSVEDKDSKNDWEWKPLDNIRVQVEVENNLDKDEDFGVELAVYDTQKHTFIELDGDSTMSDTVSIDKGDSQKVTFEFKAPTDLEDSDGGRYLVYAKAYVDGRESSICTSNHFADLQVSKKARDVVLDDITDGDIVRPGDTVTITARMYNTGSEDEDKVKTILTNSKLGLNLESNPISLDMGDSNMVTFSFVVPSDAANGVYYLNLVNYFNYKSSSDTYSRSSDTFEAKLTVAGGSNVTSVGKNAAISALLASSARSGSQMEVTATITNTANQRLSFVVGATNYESWASLGSVSDRIVTLNPGESKDVTMTFNVKDGVTGEQTFTIQAISGGVTDSKNVIVDISGGWLSSFFSSLGNSFTNNSFLWIVGIINAILVIFIIIVAVRILRR